PKGAPAKGAAAQTLESLFAAADKIGEGSDGDGVLLIFEKGVLDGLSPDGASVEELLDLSASARSITGYYVHR
ncbi:MAG: hypothetical protein KDD47_14460, partial [Acidobacteria bacterium]|nr:hypothetical protein [Acidobacteriota bacterium]